MRFKVTLAALVIAGLGAAAAATTFVPATAAEQGTHEAREAIMKKIGGSVGALAGIAKGEKPYDAAAVKTALSTIAENARAFPAQFDNSKAATDKLASPKIWENFDDFKNRSEKLAADADQLAAATPADAAAVGAAVKTLGANCSGCHQIYRLKE
ncbi:c-type cytochrome [Oryzifoliimicrobium ureilyticus]|uniref:c-type cytochrome n=1 Tax=Oryzifoliimicrobium ureilyticus TaxID=3113724 RepID=UPI003076711A